MATNITPKSPSQIAGILGKQGIITQAFGNYNPTVEKYSNGVNYGTDIAVPAGTSAYVPPGDWQVQSVFNGAKYSGANNAQGGINQGYGNSVLLQNSKTGEKLRYSHLLQALPQVGQQLTGGSQIGYTGATGNTTGDHLDLEYYNQQGKLADVFNSPYGQYVNGTPQGNNVNPASLGVNYNGKSTPQISYKDLLNQKAQQIFGNKLIAVTTDPNVAKKYSGQKGIGVQRITV